MIAQPIGLAPLPPQPTTFVGRQAEVAELARLLADPACRLVTLVGPGGIGKTRLALEAAARAAPAFPDGVAFAPLQDLPAADLLATALAQAVGCPLSGQGEPREQLLHYLRGKELLLLLDNLEHLLDGAGLLGDLLAAAPGVRLLVTSREALNLQEEWRYPLAGLEVPDDAQTGDLEGCEAVQLFVERARRVRRDFHPDEERAGVVRICRLVGGLPLALELAAAWTRTLSCAAIAAEIERNLALLATSARNVPARHRSVRAAFDQSWALLGEAERGVFPRLSIFRGGFRREAAERVAGATLPALATLLDKSLLRFEADGRYHVHELLRQYAAEQLAADPAEEARVQRAHSAYYLDFLAVRREALGGGDQREALAAIADEIENIRVAWWRVVDGGDGEAIHRAAHALARFYDFRGLYREGVAALEAAADRLSGVPTAPAELALAALQVDLARLYIRLGRHADARAALEESQARFTRLAAPPPPGQATDPLIWLGVLALIRGDYADAARLGEESRQRNEAHRHAANLPWAWYLLARAAFLRGEYEAARHAARQSYAATQAVRDRWYLAYCLNTLGEISCASGDYAAAKGYFREAYALREEFLDPEGMGVALAHLAEVALLEEDYAEARAHYQRGLALYQEIGSRGLVADALRGLGATACAVGDYAAARRYLAQALELATEVQYVELVSAILSGIGELLLRSGQPDRGVELLAVVREHPTSTHAARDRARQLLARAEGRLSPRAFAAALERAGGADLDTLAGRLQADLADPDSPAAGAPGDADTPARPPEQPLVEPLTERELAVLRLIAEGRTNREIADGLFVSVGTIKWYTGQIYGKLQVESRTQAVARARELRLLP